MYDLFQRTLPPRLVNVTYVLVMAVLLAAILLLAAFPGVVSSVRQAVNASVRRAVPPMESWFQILIAVQVLTLAVGLFFSDDLLRGEGSAFDRFNEERLDAYVAAELEGPKVVIIGNSMVKTAFPDWTETDEAPQVLRLVDNHAYFDSFRALVPDVLKAKPDIIVLQAEMLSTQPTWRTAISRFRVSQTALLLGDDDVENVELGLVCPPESDLTAIPEAEIARQLQEHTVWMETMAAHDVDAAVPLEAQDTVRRFVDAGIDVLLLEASRSPALRDHDRHFVQLRAARVAELAASSPRIHVRTMEPQGDEAFCDIRHFNARGRAVAWAWLKEQLASLRPPPGAAIP